MITNIMTCLGNLIYQNSTMQSNIMLICQQDSEVSGEKCYGHMNLFIDEVVTSLLNKTNDYYNSII